MTPAKNRFDPRMEAEYRQYYLADDSRLLVLGIIIWAITFTGFAYSDYLQLGFSQTFVLLAAIRGLYALISLLALLVLNRKQLNVATFDNVALIWAMATVVLDIGIGLLRPRDDLSVIINDLVGVFSFFIFLSGRLSRRTTPALVLSAANLLLMIFYKQGLREQELLALAFSFTITNLVGLLFSHQFFEMRRQEFATRREEARVNLELQRLAATDPLTGVYNRRRLLELAGDAFYRYRRYKRPFSILVMDLDGFKTVNDTFGHQQGDAVLIAFARSLEREKREADALGRMGGDEFCLVLPETTPEAARTLAERILMACGSIALDDKGTTVQITTSIGISQAMPDDTSLDSLFARADSALYNSKHAGRNRLDVA